MFSASKKTLNKKRKSQQQDDDDDQGSRGEIVRENDIVLIYKKRKHDKDARLVQCIII